MFLLSIKILFLSRGKVPRKVVVLTPTSCDVLHDLSLFILVLGLGQVALVEVAALHGREPGHSCLVEINAAAPVNTL